MKHIVKIMALLVAISAFWIGLLQASIIPHSYTWLLPLYLIVSFGCYGLLMGWDVDAVPHLSTRRNFVAKGHCPGEAFSATKRRQRWLELTQKI